jgi:hypothetical protein
MFGAIQSLYIPYIIKEAGIVLDLLKYPLPIDAPQQNMIDAGVASFPFLPRHSAPPIKITLLWE